VSTAAPSDSAAAPDPGQGPAPDFDPDAVPVRPASTLMIVDDRPDLQVLMIRRNTRMVFAGGMWVFPGGAVDPGEADDFEPHCDGLTDDDASATLGIDDGGLAYWIAAIRENFEEAGLLLASRTDGRALEPRDLAASRERLHTEPGAFLGVVRDYGLRLHLRDMHYIAHWITPHGSPRRFTARFFLTRPPVGQVADHDGSETIDWDWVKPDEMLARHGAGEVQMMTPTVRMLRCLAAHGSAERIVEAARRGSDDQQVRVVYRPEGGYDIVLPGESGYDEGDREREFGWIRLPPP
jgi:8-oxo-dGTP pyrophosphatase MutT (NUDIX family)